MIRFSIAQGRVTGGWPHPRNCGRDCRYNSGAGLDVARGTEDRPLMNDLLNTSYL